MSSTTVDSPLPSAPPLTTGVDVDLRECRLLGRFAILIQALMGIIVLASLLLKRARERPRRPWGVWAADISKQVVGQAFVHSSNILLSDLIAHSEQAGNPCTLYALNILIDTTIGVLILWCFLRLFNYVLIDRLQYRIFESGKYGGRPGAGANTKKFNIKAWLCQCLVYCLALTCMKAVVVGLLAITPWLIDLGNSILDHLGYNEELKVALVMGILPLTMNVLQFILIDSLIKAQGPSLQHSNYDLLPDAEPGPNEDNFDELEEEREDDDPTKGSQTPPLYPPSSPPFPSPRRESTTSRWGGLNR